jgi:hypothetical protein
MKKLILILSIITLALASEFLEETLTQVLAENETVEVEKELSENK